MRYFVLVCLLLSFAGCFGPFGAINVGGPPVVDLGTCASSPIQPGHEDKLCSRQNGSIY